MSEWCVLWNTNKQEICVSVYTVATLPLVGELEDGEGLD